MDRHEAGKPERRANRHFDRVEREPNARVQLREPRAQQQLLPPPPRAYPTSPPKKPILTPHQKPPKAPAQNHESALTDKPLNPEHTQTLGAIIAAQLGSLTDLKTYVAAA